MKNLLVFTMLFLLFPVMSVWAQQNTVSVQPTFIQEEINDPKFVNSLEYFIVQFTKRTGDALQGEFPTKISFRKSNEYQLLPNNRGIFLRLAGKTSKQIPRDEFLKKAKNDLWYIVYRKIDGVNFIYYATQIKSSLSLALAFARDPYDNYQKVENLEFWQKPDGTPAIKSKIVAILSTETLDATESVSFKWQSIVAIPNEEAKMIMNLPQAYHEATETLIKKSGGPPPPEKDIATELKMTKETMFELLKTKLMKYYDGSFAKVVESGEFEVNKYSVIVGMQTKKLNGEIKVEEIALNKISLVQKATLHFWMVFYNPDTKLVLRMVADLGELK